MPFKTRNPYYLRISENNVLPLYLYLDERHLEWMSDMVLQHVLADLRPHVIPKLKTEASIVPGNASNSKKATVDTHRGETYQFCYFFRKTEPHSVVVKTRNFIAVPPRKKSEMLPPPVPSSSKPQRGKRKSKAVVEKGNSVGARKKRKTKGRGKARGDVDELSTSSDDNNGDDFNPAEPRRSRRTTRTAMNGYQELDDNDGPTAVLAAESTGQLADIDMTDQTVTWDVDGLEPGSSRNMEVDIIHEPEDPHPSAIALELEIVEEEKPKPVLQLKYQGFNIYGHCLCIVVEPWPPIRSMSRAPSVVQALTRDPSIAPPVSVSSLGPSIRVKTPLFLPDDYRERSETPAPSRGQSVPLPTSSLLDPSFLEDSDDSDDDGGMMQFSQVLNNAGDVRAGAADDDEDMDTGVFFGDADETREL